MDVLRSLSSLPDFASLIAVYFEDVLDFLIFIGGASAVTRILAGAIMFGVGVRVNKVTGKQFIIGGIILSIIEY